MKQLVFHGDLVPVTVYVGGNAVTLEGEVEVIVKEPAKKSKQNKASWALVDKTNASAISAHLIEQGE